jgi:hypothetical protein
VKRPIPHGPQKRRPRAIPKAMLRQLKARRDRLEAQRMGRELREIRDARSHALVLRQPAPIGHHVLPTTALQPTDTDREHEVVVMDRPAYVRGGLPFGAAPLGAYFSQAEAAAALDRERDRGSGIATGLAIGLATVAVLGLGVVVCYLLFRKKDESLGSPERIEREIIREVPTYIPERRRKKKRALPTEERELALAENVGQGATMRSFFLPSLADPRSEAIRLATAVDESMIVVVRAIAPVGGFAVLSFSAAELNTPGASAIPIGDTFVVVVGEKQEIRLAPRQVLYAKGSVANVAVSVLADAKQ